MSPRKFLTRHSHISCDGWRVFCFSTQNRPCGNPVELYKGEGQFHNSFQVSELLEWKGVWMDTRNIINKGAVILYKNRFEVRLRDNTVWLTQKDMAGLFNTERSVITKHVRNIVAAGELDEHATTVSQYINRCNSHINAYSRHYKTGF